MNYIRTIDGRIAEVKENMTIKRCSKNVLRLVYKDNRSICVLNGNDDIVNQADTIEELCDEFVMTHYFKENNYTYREVLRAGKDSMIEATRLKKINNKSKAIKNEFNIYGCVWIEIKLPKHKTVFRLEPVAIMNDKGDFELI